MLDRKRLNPAKFMKKYWQKRPLLVRQAFPGFRDPLTPDELAGLATEAGVKARLVLEKGSRKLWQVEHGPFKDSRLRRLGASHWSLLVSDVNQYVDAGGALLDEFSFIPHWRMDDLMVSFAPEHGSVGPHVDSYDVFLIQGMGRRRWQISTQKDQTLRSGLPLKILKNFKAEDEWILEPGDMLYLPPGVAHWGVALEPCMTYSVGFRAPRRGALLSDLFNVPADWLAAFGDEIYGDPGLRATKAPGEITPDAVKKIRTMLLPALASDDLLVRWFGAFTTRAPADQVSVRTAKRPTAAAVERRLKAGGEIFRTDLWRLAYAPLKSGALGFWVGGTEYLLPKSAQRLAASLCSERRLNARELLEALPASGPSRRTCLDFLANLVAKGTLALAKRQG